MRKLSFSRDDGLYVPLTITSDGEPVDMSGMDFRGVIEWFDGSLEISEDAGTLIEDDATQGKWFIELTPAQTRSISTDSAAFLTMRDETPGAEYTYVERLPVEAL